MTGLRRQAIQRAAVPLERAGLPAQVAAVLADGVTLRVMPQPAVRKSTASPSAARAKPAGLQAAPVKAAGRTSAAAKSLSGAKASNGVAHAPAARALRHGSAGPDASTTAKPASGKAGSARTKSAAASQKQARAPALPPQAKLAPAKRPDALPQVLRDRLPPGAADGCPPAQQRPDGPPTALSEPGVKSKALLILDMHTFDEMHAGEIPIIPYSHDRNVLLMAHVVARRNIELFVCCGPDGARERKYRRVARVYPRWEFTRDFVADPHDIAFDLVVCAGIEALVMREHFPDAKLVGILPALHMFEAPGLFRPKFVFNFIQSLRTHIDFIITQNARMREAIVFISHWLARWDPADRVFEARLGLSRDMESVVDVTSTAYRSQRADGRRRLRLGEDDVLIVNAGGAWNWTDCDTFMEAVCLHWRQNQHRGGGRVRVYFSGITQPDNHEVNRVRDRILELLVQYPECFSNEMGDGRPIYIERDWSRGGRDIHTFLQAGDLGLSVNKVGFEGWQSHRVRIVDYIGAGLPLLAAGDDLLTREFCEPRFRAVSGSIDSYLEILAAIESGGGAAMAALKRQVVDEHRAALDGDVIYGGVIDRIMEAPRRSPELIAALDRNFLDLIQQQSEDRLRDEVQVKLRKMLDL